MATILIDENDWSLKTVCNVPQQENTEDCGIFVCLYCELILNDHALDFTQDDIRNGEWHKKTVLSILSIDNDDNNVYDPVVCIERPNPEIASHLTWARGTKYQKFVMITLDVVMSAMITAMAKTIAITRGSNKVNGRMS